MLENREKTGQRMKDFKTEARHFLEEAGEFRLGFLRSEARNPLTMNLDRDFASGSAHGVKTLLSCDMALLPLIRRVSASPEFRLLVESLKSCLDRGGKIVFSGCGAAGRLAVLLESAWRETFPGYVRVLSLLTGGDFQQNIPKFELHFNVNIRRNDAFAAKKIGVEFKADGQRNDVVQQSVTQTNALFF